MADLGDFLSLTYGEIKRSVAKLPDEVLADLVLGPMPDGVSQSERDDCRLCVVLEDHRGDGGPVDQLLEWHDLERKTFDLIRLADGDDLVDECVALTGALSYARCTTVYALAEAEAGVRRRRLEACHV